MKQDDSIQRDSTMLNLILSTAPAAIIVLDNDDLVREWSKAAEDIFGWKRDEVIGKPYPVKTAGNDNDHQQIMEQMRRQGGNVVRYIRRQRRDGSTVELQASITAITGSQGEMTGVLGILQDISGQKEARAELEQFLYMVSHDLREPLRKILGYSDLLHKDIESGAKERVREDIHFIREASDRMNRMIKSLLELSRIGRKKPKMQSVAPAACIDAAVSNLQLLIDETGAVISRDKLPLVYGEKETLVRIFQNLLQNSIKYAGQAVPKIRISAMERDGWIEIAINDNGIGIEPEYRQKVFKPFQRLASRNEGSGVGLGLPIVRRSVRMLGGRIRIANDNEQMQEGAFQNTGGACIIISLKRGTQNEQ